MKNVYDNSIFFEEYQSMRANKINANNLIEVPIMKSMLPNLKDKTVLDLGCGAGDMDKYFIECGAKKVLATDISVNMINIAKNKFREHKNVEFICADAGEAAKLLHERGLKPDVVVVDPPRKGMYEDAVNAVASMAPERIVYVSCDPATLARDILRFEGLGYLLKKCCAVDMFPRTKHVESVAVMYRK